MPSKEVGHDDEEVTAPLLVPETEVGDADTGEESQPESLDLDRQIEALQENLGETGASSTTSLHP